MADGNSSGPPLSSNVGQHKMISIYIFFLITSLLLWLILKNYTKLSPRKCIVISISTFIVPCLLVSLLVLIIHKADTPPPGSREITEEELQRHVPDFLKEENDSNLDKQKK